MRRLESSRLAFCMIGALAASLLSPAQLGLHKLESEALQPAHYPQFAQPVPSTTRADLDAVGLTETLTHALGRVLLRRGGATLWASPPSWDVRQAQVTDLDHDGQPEIAMIVWREFAPWPIDAYLPHGGRIKDFHNQLGQSCHLILIGWRHNEFAGIWAGSALADPVTAFTAADLDGDSLQELVTLESRYDDSSQSARTIKVWEWDGFGFVLTGESREGNYLNVIALHMLLGPDVLLVQATARR